MMSSSIQNKKILFICPQFYHYEIEIKDELERLNADVTAITFDEYEDFNFTGWQKVLKKLFLIPNILFLYEWMNRLFFSSFNMSVLKASHQQYDILLVIKGYGLSARTISKISAKRKIMYQWDPIDKFPSVKATYPSYDKIFTYSQSDSDNGWGTFLPNFAVVFKPEPNITVIPEVFFVGEFSQYRVKHLSCLAEKLSAFEINVNFVLVDFLNESTRDYPGLTIVHEQINRKDYFDWASRAQYHLDISRFGEQLPTQRSSDAIAAGTFLLSDNPDFGVDFTKVEKCNSIECFKALFENNLTPKQSVIMVDSWVQALVTSSA